MKNGQSAALNLSNEQLQVILTGKFGDGSLTTPKTCTDNSLYSTNCINKEYIDFKGDLLGDLLSNKNYRENTGYSKKIIWYLTTHVSSDITTIKNMSIEEALNLMDELGLALWFYDDGSLHKSKLFYNLNTQEFSREINEDIFVPFLAKFGITAKVSPDRKKDGTEYWYLRIGRYDGSYEISTILNKYPINCFNYKVWSSETIQNWSKLQEELKRIGKLDSSNRTKAAVLSKIEKSNL